MAIIGGKVNGTPAWRPTPLAKAGRFARCGLNGSSFTDLEAS